MGQSLVKNYVHFVFSTKNLMPLIQPQFEIEIYKYMSGICRNISSPSLQIGGHLNHVHILCFLSKKISVSEFCKKLKASSSKWIKTLDPSLSNFYWQDGYGAFSVSPSHVNNLVEYISNQHQHHQKKSFKEEYVALLQKYNLDYKSEYLWS